MKPRDYSACITFPLNKFLGWLMRRMNSFAGSHDLHTNVRTLYYVRSSEYLSSLMSSSGPDLEGSRLLVCDLQDTVGNSSVHTTCHSKWTLFRMTLQNSRIDLVFMWSPSNSARFEEWSGSKDIILIRL